MYENIKYQVTYVRKLNPNKVNHNIIYLMSFKIVLTLVIFNNYKQIKI